MVKTLRYILPVLFLVGFTGLLWWLTQGTNVAILEPKGLIADKQRNLLVFSTVLSLFVIIPVYLLTFFILWKYRASNTRAQYSPNWDSDKRLEAIWWGIPMAIIVVLSVVTWHSSHALDPFKPISSSKETLKIQVVALQWKWLFIYPEQQIATINYVRFPEDRPVDFIVTADAPMNALWIPQLGGQVYAMSGMSTHLHVLAHTPGSYAGSSANISGEGFSGMKFTANATSEEDFADWVHTARLSTHTLDSTEYARVASKSKNSPAALYGSTETGLYDRIVMKYMAPAGKHGQNGAHSHAH